MPPLAALVIGSLCGGAGAGWLLESRCSSLFVRYFDYEHVHFDYESGRRTEFHYLCKDRGMAFHLINFHVQVDAYLSRLRAMDSDRALFYEPFLGHLRGGVVLCVPAKQCLEDFEDIRALPRRGMDWWTEVGLAAAPGPASGAATFLCNTILPPLVFKRYGLHPRDVNWLPAPNASECTAAFVEVGSVWRRDAEALFERPGSALDRPRPSVAICVSGQVRTFPWPDVHLSMRDNVVRSLNASFTKLFFVLNLDSVNTTLAASPLKQSVSLAEVLPAIHALGEDLTASITIEPTSSWPRLEDGLQYSDCFFDSGPCPVSWRGKELCEANIREYELTYDLSFDWVVDLRPDLRFNFPVGDARRFDSESLYSSYYVYTELSDRFNLVPRRLMPVYVSAFRGGTNRSAYRCQTAAGVREALRRGACTFGSCGCLLQQHLAAHAVPVKRMPREIYSVVRLDGQIGG